MSLAGRVGAAFLVLIALMVALAGYHLSLVHRLHEDNRRLIRVELELSRISLTMRRDVEELLRLTQVFYVLRDAGYGQRIEARRERVEAGLDRLREMEVTPEEQGALAFFAVAWREYADRAPQVEAEFLASGDERARAELIAELAAFDESLVALDTAARQAMDEQVAASAEKAARAQTTAWTTTTTAAAAALVLALLLAGSVARPLSRLGRGTHEMAEGNFGYRVEASGGRELVALADDFNRMADRLGELDELKKDFVSTMSHDLKAPLASMQETTSLLLEGTPGTLTESQQRLLRLNLQCGERLSAMIGDLLEVARLEAGSVDFELEADDLAVVARQALDEAEGSIAARRLTVDARLAPTPVLADRDLVLRLLWNLVSNAVKFSPEGGTVIVRVGRYDNAAELDAAYFRRPGEVPPPVAVCEVEDAGPGIPDAAKPLVFDRFHRVDAKRRGVQGTGLGLSIAHAVATGHGGELWVEDAVAAPTGSRFVLVLPLRRDPPTV